MKRLMLLLMLPSLLALSGCDVDEANKLIATTNAERVEAFANGLVACGDNAACQVAVSMAFAGGLGQQQLFRPDTIVDYLRAGLPYGDLSLRLVSLLNTSSGVSGDRATNVIKGDGNTLLIGNRTTATEQSTASLALDASYSRQYDGGQNRNYTGGTTINDEGVQ